MATQTTVTLNPGSGGSNVSVIADASGNVHEQVVIQTQTGASDPVAVGASNPLPVIQAGPLLAGSNVIGAVNQNGSPWGVSQSGTWTVNGNVAAGTADSGAGVKVSAVYNTVAPSYTTGQRTDLQADASGNLCVNIKAGQNTGGTSSNFSSAFPGAGTAIGAQQGSTMVPLVVDGSGNLKVNIAAGSVQAATDNTAFTAGTTTGLQIMGVYNDSISALTSGNSGSPRMTSARQLLVAPQASVNGGWTPGRLVSAASTNGTVVKASPGQLGHVVVGNNGAGWAYLKLYNATSVTVGTTVPVQTLPIPPGGGCSLPLGSGLQFTTGICLALTGLPADTDTTAVAANQLVVSYGFA